MSTPKISLLLATRKRPEMLKRSLFSLIDNATDPSRIEMMLGFDDDDQETVEWAQENILPELDARGVEYVIMSFERLGYIRLNEYYNELALNADGDWLLFWGDDAIMETQGWDDRILDHDGQFHVLRVKTHNEHPLAIFPIVPKEWVELFGYFSPHSLNDNWISQVAYMANRLENIEVTVTHDRFDLTGNNNDENFQNRPMLEGNPADPRYFHHPSWTARRQHDTEKLCLYLKDKGEDISWWENVKIGQQDPWARLRLNDPNKQMMQFNLPRDLIK